MFTVLVRHANGREVLFEAERVEYQNNGEPGDGLLITLNDMGIKGPATTRQFAHSEVGDTDSRDVFVMNEAGQTVARYIL